MSESRYSRQIRFGGVGESGQARISAARVAIVGCGALGSVQAELLARAGTGFLRLIDRDYVEPSNLQRQFLYDEDDAAEAMPKAAAAQRRLMRVNSTIVIEPQVADLTSANIDDLFEDIDLIVDGSDNFETRYLINDWAVRENKPWIYGAAVGSYGITFPVLPGTGCFACVYPHPPQGAQPTCETAGVLGSVTATIAALQCAMALKILVGAEAPARVMTTVDLWKGETRQIRLPVSPDPDCAACGSHREYRYLDGRQRAPISLCGRDAVQIHERRRPVDLAELAARLALAGEVRANEFALRFSVDSYQLTVFPDGRAIIKGTTDPGVARSLYSRYIGN